MSEIRTLTVRSTDSPSLARPPQPHSVSGPVHAEGIPAILIDEERREARISSPAPKRPRPEEEHHQVLILQHPPTIQGIPNFGLIQHTLEVGSISSPIILGIACLVIKLCHLKKIFC